MQLSLKLTERDKKLLAVLAVVLVIAGLGGQVILPLMDKNTQLRAELDAAKLEQTEKQIKVSGLAGMRAARDASKEKLAEVSKNYLGIVKSKEIDRILTETALSAGVNILGLNIAMPGEEVTSIMDYHLMLQMATTEDIIRSYTGFYTVSTTLRMSGSRDALQSVLDNLSHREPFCRVSAFQWETTRSEGEALSINLEIYMMQNAEEFMASAQAAGESEEGTESETTEDELLTE